MATPVEQIKERLSILDVVAPYVQLHKAGKNFKGKSPFTNEKTPSFFVSPDRGVYYCFSSGKGGDVFSFIEEMEGVDFKGALKMLAERAHISLIPESPQKRDERETLYAILEAANVYFADNLKKNIEVRKYLNDRGVTDASIEKWRIGHVPDEWRSLKDHLGEKRFTEAMMLRSGLIKQAEEQKTFYDVFRGRVMFPIAAPSGRTIAFSGRTLSKDPVLPKYVNSPETELFQKSHALFGYHLAKQSIRAYDFSLIVEGQFDLVLAHQAGFGNTVAISGTALSEYHTELLSRLSNRVVLALDADRAGVQSVKRIAHTMLGRGMDVKVARVPSGKDPADLVAEDPALLKTAVREATTVIEFLVDVLRKGARDERAFRLSVRDEVLPFIARIPDRIDREHFEALVGEALKTTKDAIHHEVERLLSKDSEEIPEVAVETFAKEQKSIAAPVRTDELVRLIYGITLWQESIEKEASDKVLFESKEIQSTLKQVIGEDAWQHVVDNASNDRDKLIFEAELHYGDTKPEKLLTEVHGHLHEISERVLKAALKNAREELKKAEIGGNGDEIERMLEVCTSLQKRLSVLGHDH